MPHRQNLTGCCLARKSSTGKMGCLLDRSIPKPLGAGGDFSGLDPFSCCLARKSNTGKMGCLFDRSIPKALGAGGGFSGLDPFSSSALKEACDCSFRQPNCHVIHKSPVWSTFNVPTLHPAVVQAIWFRFGKAKVDLLFHTGNHTLSLLYLMVGPRGPLG